MKLCEELLKVPTDNPSMDELSALPYLDTVVRETLRVHSPVPSSVRVAMKDDVIPLNTPFIDKNGQTQHVVWYVQNVLPNHRANYICLVNQSRQRRYHFHPYSSDKPVEGYLGRGRDCLQVYI